MFRFDTNCQFLVNIENTAKEFLEISSEQRLNILVRLYEKKSKISLIAKELDATVPEVFRNFERMVKNGLIKKENDRYYSITAYGKSVYSHIPSTDFFAKNKKFFVSHDFGELQMKFIQRLGALQSGKHIKGFVKVLEQWKKIHQNSEQYIYNILPEVPYSQDIIDIVSKKLKADIEIKSIFSEDTIIPDERKEIFSKKNFQKFVKSGLLERKMTKKISVVTLLNEKEGCVIFPKIGEGPDMSEMFYGQNDDFHDWCLDYFEYCWKNSGAFQESKLKL